MENRWNVQCYGRGDVHEKIVKELNINNSEDPGDPCVLIVYKVSRETQDLQNALQWVTEKQRVKREDIGVVILLEKCLDKVSKPVEVAHQGMFDANTVVVRILWEQQWWNSSVKTQDSPSNKEAMEKVKRSINRCQADGVEVPDEAGLQPKYPTNVEATSGGPDTMDNPSRCTGSSQEDSGDFTSSKHGSIQKDSLDEPSGNSSQNVAKKTSDEKGNSSSRSVKQKHSTNFSKDDCFHQPKMEDRNMETLWNYLVNYKPPKSFVNRLNILLLSLLRPEEPSVIHAFISALDIHTRDKNSVPTGDIPSSLTPQNSQLIPYRVQSIILWDTHGWDTLENMDRTKRVLHMLLEGRVQRGTDLQKINPDSDVDKYPVSPNDVIHGVAFISDVSTIGDHTMNQLKELHTVVAQKSIYSVVIGTKFEQLGIEENDHKRIYEYWPLQEKFKRLSESTGMEMRSMFVVSNQQSGQITRTNCILALYALNNVVRNVDKYLTVTM